MPDRMVLQHDLTGTIHEIRKDGRSLCGRKNTSFKKKRLSTANKHPLAHFCGAEKAKR